MCNDKGIERHDGATKMWRDRVSLAFLALGLALAAGGCKKDDKKDEEKKELAIEELAAAYAEAMCAALERCPAGKFVMDIAGWEKDCKGQFAYRMEDGWLLLMRDAIGAGKVTYNGEAASACVEAIKGLSCEVLSPYQPVICNKMFEGTAAAGAQCSLDEECPEDHFCRIGDSCPGTCTPRGQIGGECIGEEGGFGGIGMECPDGLVCHQGECVEPIPAGGQCEEDGTPCAAGSECVLPTERRDDEPVRGSCKRFEEMFVAREGELCDFEANLFCSEGLFCAIQEVGPEGMTSRCIGPATAGGPCKAAMPDSCPTGTVCDVTLEDIMGGQIEGTCVESPGAGERCGGFLGMSCAEGLVCVGEPSTCRPMARLGGQCEMDGQCYSDRCEGGVCVAPDPCED